MRFFYDQYNNFRERFLDAQKRGDHREARFSLLKASEYLYKLAAATDNGSLRKSRVEHAGRLLESARNIETGQGTGGGVVSTQTEIPHPAADGDGSQAKRWILIKKPNVHFQDVVGLEDVKELIRKRVIYPFQHPDITSRYRKTRGGGVLLFGPPGTGKTMMAKAIATELDAVFFDIRCSDIMSKWVGEAEKNLAELFAESKSYTKTVIFMDETEAIVSKRGGDSTVMNRVIPEFLSQIDGMDPRENCLLVLGATNRPWDMDEAALRTGRFGEMIYVGLPDLPARKRILEINLDGVPLDPAVEIDEIAMRLDRYSGADIKGLCQTATDFPYDREIKTGQRSTLTMEDLDKAIAKRRPSVTPSMLSRYNKFMSTFE